MKKIIAIALALVLAVGLTACSGNSRAFRQSQLAFNDINEAYEMVNTYSEDIYEAWRLGINDKYSYDNDYELSSLASELHVSTEDLQKAIANLLGFSEYTSGNWSRLQTFYNDSFFSAVVSVVSEAYVCNGTASEIESLLTNAKNTMKGLSDRYSDYEHYPALKSYFTNTLAFFDFCKNPEGSFEQVVETFNTYRNNAREYFFELNYVFADSIGGMKEETEEDTTPSATA